MELHAEYASRCGMPLNSKKSKVKSKAIPVTVREGP
jgi:hypothetical protein